MRAFLVLKWELCMAHPIYNFSWGPPVLRCCWASFINLCRYVKALFCKQQWQPQLWDLRMLWVSLQYLWPVRC